MRYILTSRINAFVLLQFQYFSHIVCSFIVKVLFFRVAVIKVTRPFVRPCFFIPKFKWRYRIARKSNPMHGGRPVLPAVSLPYPTLECKSKHKGAVSMYETYQDHPKQAKGNIRVVLAVVFLACAIGAGIFLITRLVSKPLTKRSEEHTSELQSQSLIS